MAALEKPCRHIDIRVFDDVKSCLACGETAFATNLTLDIAPTPEVRTAFQYSYSPLNYKLGQEIRLLVLSPGRKSDNLWCRIIHVNLDNLPVYEALSYTWANEVGDKSLSQHIIHVDLDDLPLDEALNFTWSNDEGDESFPQRINPFKRTSTIAITKNCEAALRCIRRIHRERTIWVDAICIDQENIGERNHQVGFMASIYSNASQVIAYLGPGSVDTDMVMDHLNKTHLKPGDNPVRQMNAAHVESFFRLPYFSRVWVLQEIGLAKLVTMLVGNKETRWTREAVDELLDHIGDVTISVPDTLQWLPGHVPEQSLLEALYKSRNCSASDPRDKVYALLGLVDPQAIQGFPVDYSYTEAEVYTSVSKHLVAKFRCLSFLKYLEPVKLRSQGVSSWVPCWGVKCDTRPMPSQFSESDMSTLSESWYLPKELQDPKRIESYDLVLSRPTLSSIEPNRPTSKGWAWPWPWLRGWQKHIGYVSVSVDREIMSLYTSFKSNRHFQFSTVKGAEPIDSMPDLDSGMDHLKYQILRVRAHYLDTVKNTADGPGANDYSFEGWKTFLVAPGSAYCSDCSGHEQYGPDNCPLGKTYPAELKRSLWSLQRYPWGGSPPYDVIFWTEFSMGSMYPGYDIKTGDTIWALPTVDVPFVLRRVGNHYVLIGACYLHRATQNLQCRCCMADAGPWPMVTQIIDIW